MGNKILFVNSCARENSRTYALAKCLLDCIKGEIAEVDLYKTNVKPVDNQELERRTRNIKNGDFSCEEFKQAKQFKEAEIIVIAAPFWDLSFPSVLSKSSSRRDLMRHLYATGIRTLPVVTVTSFFTGMILSLQVGLELARFNQEIYLGAAVMISLIREMGPFSCGMCLAACVGSAIAAELGTMKVNDEIAALEIMSISPIKYLASPRIMALLLMSPLLAFYCCVTGTVGGGLVGQTQLGVDFGQYMASAMSVAETKDLFVGLLKAAVFSIVIGGVSVAQGFATSRGATGVGKSTQRSVIISFLLILILGYMITRLCYQ
jgi:phospholipid/cholesterol/gamma-HCH transport system permease protein